MIPTMLKIRREKEVENGKLYSWALIPLTDDCPYLYGAYDPENELLFMQFKTHKLETKRVYQTDEKGQIRTNKHGIPFQPYEQVDDEYFQIVVEKKDIPAFLEFTCVNSTAEFRTGFEAKQQEETKEEVNQEEQMTV
jgi:hypothetical protein